MSIFREYDIRGIFNKDLHEENVVKIGYLLGLETKKYDSKVAIGYDARVHSTTLFSWLARGFHKAGVAVYNLGMIPTPVAYFCVFNTDIKSSVMITGSHNPPEYNGFKITINRDPFYGNNIESIKTKISNLTIDINDNINANIANLNVLQDYTDFMTNEFSMLKDWNETIAFDCGNGVASIALARILDNLNIKSVRLFFDPDGTFPNHHPDPSEEKNLIDLKQALDLHNIHVGIAYDGDADRVALISKNHSFKGDELAILFAKDIATRKQNPIIIGEVKCSQAMYDEINKFGKAVMYKTGHSNLKVKLKELNADLACEMSGHIFFKDRYFGYDDAIYASFRILEMIYKRGKGLENVMQPLEQEILGLAKTYNTDEEKIAVTEDSKFVIIHKLKGKLEKLSADSNSNFPHIRDIIDIDGVRVIFDNGWGLVRASNTTPMLVTRFEAYSEADLSLYKQSLLSLLDI